MLTSKFGSLNSRRTVKQKLNFAAESGGARGGGGLMVTRPKDTSGTGASRLSFYCKQKRSEDVELVDRGEDISQNKFSQIT